MLTARRGDRPCPRKDASLPCCHALGCCHALPCCDALGCPWMCSSSGAEEDGAEACAEAACAEAACAEAAFAEAVRDEAACAEACAEACALSTRARSVGQPCWSAGGMCTPSSACSSPG